MRQFLKANQVTLMNGGYLSNTAGNPVFNQKFVDAQKKAEYVITFAKLAKGKNFKECKVDSLSDLQAEVLEALKAKQTQFVTLPTEVKGTLTSQLLEEAMAFINYKEDTSAAQKVNTFMQDFAILKEFEDFGLFFEDDITKLNKIYSLEEVLEAVVESIELL